jgi:hypothetical protein
MELIRNNLQLICMAAKRAFLGLSLFCSYLLSSIRDEVFRPVTLLEHGLLLLKSVLLHNVNLDRFNGGKSVILGTAMLLTPAATAVLSISAHSQANPRDSGG